MLERNPSRIDLSGAITAFERLSSEAYSYDAHSFASLFLAQITHLLRELQAGRVIDETEWLESLDAVRIVSEMDGGPYV